MRISLTAAFLVGLTGLASAADLPRRSVVKSPAPAPSAACLESSGLPTDVFGFATGSDVNDLGALSGAIEYNGNFGTRFGSLSGTLVKAQLSYSPLRCLEIGPSIQGFGLNAGRNTLALDQRQFGGAVEFKYKVLGRATHGVGLTFTTEPGVFSRKYESGFLPLKPTGTVVTNLARMLVDFEIVKNRVFGAINVEYGTVWDNPVSPAPSGYARFSALNLRAAAAYKVSDTFYVGVEGSHQRAYTGLGLNKGVGNAWFVGPTFYWQATEKFSITGSYNYQVAGVTNNAFNVTGGFGSRGVDLVNFNRHLAKLKVAYSF